ncbi:unnamed protein product [Aureobasidium mustum]|uniref:Uncharacterized protein n=1 Tax=Aureobasidium mustum TaxID=2773714 RepID=A0A9N8JCC7_9PEZI|nr:unnamed protein product [Aureobasidium mustum]
MAPVTLTEREKELLTCVFQCLKNPPEVDLDKLAAISGYKTRASANTAYHKLKAKIGKAESEEDDADAADDDAEADAEDTPVASTATKKARGKKAAAVKAEEPETDEDDESETVAVKAKPKSTRAAPSRKAAKPVASRRSTRNSLKASKPVIKDMSSGDSEDEVPAKRPITLKRGMIVYPTEEEIYNFSRDLVSADAPLPIPENTAANTLKRAATEPGSDFDELASDPKRPKVDTEITPAVEHVEHVVPAVDNIVPTIVSTDPVVETYVVNDPDTVDVSTEIRMAVDEGSDAAASDVASNVASAATSGDHDDN